MKKIFKNSLKIISIILCCCIVFGGIFLSAFIFSCYKNINKVNVNLNSEYDSYQILDSENKFLNEKKYIYVEEVPNKICEAFISIEDKDFYKHNGINYKRILKASFNNLKSLSLNEGASTITQQLIKNKYLTNEKTFKRKFNEIFLAKKIEKKYNKQQILNNYLNIIYFGHGCYGIGTASKFYFNKNVNELNINEIAVLAAIIKSPNNYSPIKNEIKCFNRKNLVLKELFKDKKINQKQLNNNIKRNIELNINKDIIKETTNDIYLNNYILNEASALLNLKKSEIIKNKYKIKTTLKKELQYSLKKEMLKEENFIANKNGYKSDGLGIIIDNKTNKILAYYSNSDYDVYNINRQPGSAIKPIFVYAPAFERGYSPATKIKDEPINIKGYKPNNLNGIYNGYVSIDDAVAKSLNIPAIKIVEDLGIKYCKNFAENIGIKFDKKDKNYALALGGFTKGITLKSLTNAYATFADNGNYKECYIIDEITTKDNILIYKNNKNKEKKINSDTSYLTISTLMNSVKKGTSRKLKDLNYQVAGKTGTVCVKNSNLNTDCYSIASTSELTCGVWLGNYTYQKSSMLEGSNNGGTYATQIIKNIFNNIYKNNKPKNFAIPDLVIYKNINDYEYEYNNSLYLSDSLKNNKKIFSKRYLPNVLNKKIHINKIIDFIIKNNEVIIKVKKNDLLIINDIYLVKNKNQIINSLNKNNDLVFYFSDLNCGKYDIIVKYQKANDNNINKIKYKSIYIA